MFKDKSAGLILAINSFNPRISLTAPKMEEEWTTEANDALTIALVKAGENGVEKIGSFHPKFTYAIFEEERIFGYKGLKLHLSFNASDLRPNFATPSFKQKFKTVGEVEPFDVVGTMKKFLPGVAFQKKQDFELAVKKTSETWTPPGELIKTEGRDGKTYEIWKGSLADPAVKQLVNRIQICVLFFIEGGSYVGQDADGKDEPEYSLARWSVYFLYEKQPVNGAEGKHQYIFQGYSTVYHFWLYQPATPPASPGNERAAIQPKTDSSWELPAGDLPYTQLPHRARISQFLILPHFQGQGAGSLLYRTIFEVATNDDFTKEVTVEDPNEEFDLLRDLCDLKYLRKNVPEYVELMVNSSVKVPAKGGILHHNTAVSLADGTSSSSPGILDMAALENLRIKVKIAPRQFARLVEMHLMSKLPDSVRPRPGDQEKKDKPSPEDKHLYTLWRILLKQRLYRRNVTILGEFEIPERIMKLDETLENVEWEYARILERLGAKRLAKEETQRIMDEVMAPRSDLSSSLNGKRKADEENGDADTSARKKARVDDE